jgi:hypothetical protein
MADPHDEESPTEPTPLYAAIHAGRYERQGLIREYQDKFDCRLIVMLDDIFPASLTPFEDLLYDADTSKDLHFMLWTPGGDGEAAIRLLRTAQSRCKNLVLIVPDWAKSAGTLIVLGANRILMGPAGDLGPVDPQLRPSEDSHRTVAAKDIVAAVEDATEAVQANPHTYPIYADLLSNVSAVMLQQARAAIARTDTLLDLALRANTARDDTEVERLKGVLKAELVDRADYHGQLYGYAEAATAGLPVELLDPAGDQWKLIWKLWTRYQALPRDDHIHVYEGARASEIMIH